MSKGSNNNLISNLVAMARTDMKKTVSLAVLGVVLAVMLAKQMLGGPSRPASAGAAAASVRDGERGDSSIQNTARSSAAAEALRKWSQTPLPEISRNLFAVRIEYFPLDGSRTTKSVGGDEGFWSSLEKSLTLRTDEKVRHDNLVASFKAQAEQLQLQSTLPEARKAMINGQLVGEGSVVANFRVVKIEPRKVIVEREGITLSIQMK